MALRLYFQSPEIKYKIKESKSGWDVVDKAGEVIHSHEKYEYITFMCDRLNQGNTFEELDNMKVSESIYNDFFDALKLTMRSSKSTVCSFAGAEVKRVGLIPGPFGILIALMGIDADESNGRMRSSFEVLFDLDDPRANTPFMVVGLEEFGVAHPYAQLNITNKTHLRQLREFVVDWLDK
jgi:hypothetical protein